MATEVGASDPVKRPRRRRKDATVTEPTADVAADAPAQPESDDTFQGDAEDRDALKELLSPRARAAMKGLNTNQVNRDELLKDIERFRRKEAAAKQSEPQGGPLEGVKGVISWLLVADFAAVVLFLVWFLAGVGASYGLKQDFLLDSFQAAWTPLVQPALGVLMAGTIAGGLLGRKEES